MNKAKNAPQIWGQRSQDFYAALREQNVTVATTGGKLFKGTLIGVDVYDIFIRQASGLDLLINKGNVVYVHATPSTSSSDE